MVHVVLGGDCPTFTGGASEFDIEASTVRGLLQALDARFPGLGAYADKRMAVAIDGEIHQDAWFAAIGPHSEVVLIPKIGGG